MGVLQNAVKRKTHKERDQPKARKRKFGMLEKHKDYKLRAADYQSKKKRLNALRRKAELRNPDEFYFGMVNQTTKNGVHQASGSRKNEVSGIEFEEDKVPDKVLRIVRTQNLNQLNSLLVQETSKLEKLKRGLHFVDEARPNHHVVFEDDEEEEKEKEKQREHLLVEGGEETDEEDMEEFYYTSSSSGSNEKKQLRPISSKNTEKAYKHLLSAMQKVDTVKSSISHLEMKRNLMGKGRRIKLKDGEEGKPPVYRWKNERKR